jgi:TetR/AcrR family transcriptional regulator, regulator of cefoperazone and chloramphenicol sensitivity
MNSAQTKLKTVKRSRKSPDSDPTRDKLLDAAGRIFADRGYRAATIREICVAAGANVAAVNYHFGDKLGLYTEVVRQSARIAEFQAAQTVIDRDAPAEEVLRAIIRARLHSLFRGDRPDWSFRIMAHELAQPTPALRRLVNKAGQPVFHRLLGLIGGMIGLSAEDETTRLCAISLLGQIMVYALAGPLVTAIWPEFEPTPEQVERIADHIADFSLSYIQNFRSTNSARSIQRSKRSIKPRASK